MIGSYERNFNFTSVLDFVKNYVALAYLVHYLPLNELGQGSGHGVFRCYEVLG